MNQLGADITEAHHEVKFLSVAQKLKSAATKPWNKLIYQPMRHRDRATKRLRAFEPFYLMSIYGHLYSKNFFHYS